MRFIFRLLPISLRERILFIIRVKCLPKFKRPATYNQKINHRKLYWTNSLFSLCSDKVAAKEYARQNIGHKYIIENVFVGSHITLSDIKILIEEHGSLVIKANHNSGPVHFVDKTSTMNEISSICENLNEQLKLDYGLRKNEPWYSKITPAILAEKRIFSKDGEDLWDYKFHVFNNNSLDEQTVVLHVDYDRNKSHNRSFYDEKLNWLPFSLKYPCLKTRMHKPENYEEMLSIAKKLARPFSYARVDLYNVDGAIYFGEITFAHGSGREKFSSIAYDYWMGSLWKGDPAS